MANNDTLPTGSFNLILPREVLLALLDDKAIYSFVGPYRLFFQLDDGTKPIVHTVEEFREKRGEIHELTWKHVEPMPTQATRDGGDTK